jgi:hypothetical protein
MVEVFGPFLLWWRYSNCPSYGGDKRTCYGRDILIAPLMVEINRLYLLWWRYSDCSSYGGDKQTVPVMVEIF